MKEIEFDLLTEPWIRVRLKDNAVQEVSLTEALVCQKGCVGWKSQKRSFHCSR